MEWGVREKSKADGHTARVEGREGRHCRREDGMNKQSCFSTSGTCILHRSHACFLSLVLFVFLSCPLFCFISPLLVPSSRSSFVLPFLCYVIFMLFSNPLNPFSLYPSLPMLALTPIQLCMQICALKNKHSCTVKRKT